MKNDKLTGKVKDRLFYPINPYSPPMIQPIPDKSKYWQWDAQYPELPIFDSSGIPVKDAEKMEAIKGYMGLYGTIWQTIPEHAYKHFLLNQTGYQMSKVMECYILTVSPTESEEKPANYQCNDCKTHSFIKEIGGCPACNSLNITKMEDRKFAYPHLPLSKEDQQKLYWDANARDKMSKLLGIDTTPLTEAHPFESVDVKADAQPVKEVENPTFTNCKQSSFCVCKSPDQCLFLGDGTGMDDMPTSKEVKSAEEIEQYFHNHSDCYADTDNGLPIPAMTLDAVKRLFYNAQFATEAGGGKEIIDHVTNIIKDGLLASKRRDKVIERIKALTAPSTHSSSEMVDKYRQALSQIRRVEMLTPETEAMINKLLNQ